MGKSTMKDMKGKLSIAVFAKFQGSGTKTNRECISCSKRIGVMGSEHTGIGSCFLELRCSQATVQTAPFPFFTTDKIGLMCPRRVLTQTTSNDFVEHSQIQTINLSNCKAAFASTCVP